MALAWFVCQYEIMAPPHNFRRFCAMNDFNTQIQADGGAFAESEVLGGYALVKVRASSTTLTTIGNTANFFRIPNWVNLTDTLGSLTTTQRNAIQTRILAMGYTQAEINAALGSTLSAWRTITLGQVLRFITTRRLLSRWDAVQQQFVLDGPAVPCEPVANIDTQVQ